MLSRESLERGFGKWWFSNMDAAGRRRLWMKLAKLIENRVPIVMALETLYTRRSVNQHAILTTCQR